MFTYQIKENGYTIGQTVGKKKAVEFIEKELSRLNAQGRWSNCTINDVKCTVLKDGFRKEFLIEKSWGT